MLKWGGGRGLGWNRKVLALANILIVAAVVGMMTPQGIAQDPFLPQPLPLVAEQPQTVSQQQLTQEQLAQQMALQMMQQAITAQQQKEQPQVVPQQQLTTEQRAQQMALQMMQQAVAAQQQAEQPQTVSQQPILMAQYQMPYPQPVVTPQKQTTSPPQPITSPPLPMAAPPLEEPYPITTNSWDRPSMNTHYRRPSVNSFGFYVGAFGGGVLLPTDLMSSEYKEDRPKVPTSLYGDWVDSEVHVRAKVGYDVGLTLGYDFNECWGIESRLHLMKMNLDAENNFTLWRAKQNDYGYGYHYYVAIQNSDTIRDFAERTLTIFDVSAHWYPWGNARCSPYLKAGVGYANHKIKWSEEERTDYGMSTGETVSKSMSSDVFAMPLGVGLRYQWSPQVSLRLDLTDNILFKSRFGGSGEDEGPDITDIKTNHNLALTVGVTYSFGGGFQSARRY